MSASCKTNGFSRMAMFAIFLAALFLTGVTLFLLPALDALSAKPVERIEYRPVKTLELPPEPAQITSPAKPSVETKSLPLQRQLESQKPRLELEKPRAPRPRLPVQNELAFQPPSLDLKLDFKVAHDEKPLPALAEMSLPKDDVVTVTPAEVADTTVPAGGTEGTAEGSGLTFGSDEVDAAPQPISCPRPQFPYRAKMRGVSGEVRVAFTVLENGMVENAEVIAVEPSGFFKEAALDAIRKWHFSPGKKQGKPVRTRLKTTIEFKLIGK